MSFSKAELKLMAALLTEAGNEYDCHGCNDFDLDEFVTPEERGEFIFMVNREVIGKPFENHRHALPDSVVLALLAQRAREELDSLDTPEEV